MEEVYSSRFVSLEAAQKAIDSAARAQGFALAVRTKRPNAANPTYVLLRCSKGRRYDPDRVTAAYPSKRRSTNTQMTGCGFQIIVKRDRYECSWMVAATGADHNHEFTTATTHSKYRREIIERYRSQIIRLHSGGLRPALIRARLQQPDGQTDGQTDKDPRDVESITSRQINNLITAMSSQG